MVAKLELTISVNNKVMQTVFKETNTQPACMVKSLEDFQRLVNAALTTMVESSGGSGVTLEMEDDDASDEDEEDAIPASPKKKKKNAR